MILEECQLVEYERVQNSKTIFSCPWSYGLNDSSEWIGTVKWLWASYVDEYIGEHAQPGAINVESLGARPQ